MLSSGMESNFLPCCREGRMLGHDGPSWGVPPWNLLPLSGLLRSSTLLYSGPACKMSEVWNAIYWWLKGRAHKDLSVALETLSDFMASSALKGQVLDSGLQFLWTSWGEQPQWKMHCHCSWHFPVSTISKAAWGVILVTICPTNTKASNSHLNSCGSLSMKHHTVYQLDVVIFQQDDLVVENPH